MLSQILLTSRATGAYSTRFEFATGPSTLNDHETSVPLQHCYTIGTTLSGSKSEDLALLSVEFFCQEHGPAVDSFTSVGMSLWLEPAPFYHKTKEPEQSMRNQ